MNITLKSNKIIAALGIVGLLLFLFVRPDIYLSTPAGADTALRLNDFVTTFRSIIIQSLPFIVLGISISVLVAIYFREEWILKFLPKNRFLSHAVVSLFGVFMPVCECGNVPVARRLIIKGFSVSQAFTFLLAAPIINPVTIWSTYEAFKDIYPDPIIIVGRILGAFIIANIIGILLSYKSNQYEYLTDKFYKEVCDHVDEFKDNKFSKALDLFQREFLTIIVVLFIGAAIASASQTLIPREVILSIGNSPVLSIVAMILFSFAISVCSSVDSFLVIGYTSSFTIGSILSYLTFGPMIDIKILTLLRSTFKTKTLLIVTGLVTLFSILIGLVVNYLV